MTGTGGNTSTPPAQRPGEVHPPTPATGSDWLRTAVEHTHDQLHELARRIFVRPADTDDLGLTDDERTRLLAVVDAAEKWSP